MYSSSVSLVGSSALICETLRIVPFVNLANVQFLNVGKGSFCVLEDEVAAKLWGAFLVLSRAEVATLGVLSGFGKSMGAVGTGV
jgi:hypothetical protein